MAGPSWPAGQWQDHNYRRHHANQLYHQLSAADMDESKPVESMLQLPPQYQEQGSFELGGISASTGPIIRLNSSQVFGTNDEVFWPQPKLAVLGSSQLLQPSESFPASQATKDRFPSLTSGLGQATPSGSGVQAQPVYPPAFSLIDPTYPRALPVPSNRGYDTLIAQSPQYQVSAGQNHPGAVTNLELQPSQGNHSILHAQSQRQLSLGSFGSTLPLPVNDDMTQILQRTRFQHSSSKQRTSSNAAPRDVPRARKPKAVTPNLFVVVSQALLVQVYDESHRKMISLTFEEGLFPTAKELTKRATKALDEVVARHADEGIKNWRSTDGEARITKLKAVVTMLHRDFADRIGNVITGFQLTFNITKSKAEMDLQRYTVVTTMLLDNSFLDGHLEIPVNASESRMCRIPFAHPTIVDFMEEMLSRQQYSRFIPFHEDVQWKKCIRNITCFIAALCRSKMRHAAGMDTITRFPSQQDKDWYAAAIKDIRSFTGDKERMFNYFIQAMPRMLGLSNTEEVARNSVE
ncbi:uncharacterized protein HD556DRAFT_1444533 [Suillus plorans]|uniref:Uncharacterized protein n=1 Tax=Suillus plorans TaxID=116603 RepID=A0A9P7ANR6_9AGAM|nr:uncharacterized protein HD556DRAFT_1444533 [Suillus plorans]KAG1792267.1 hypothetical protein HD556DRAFT_1444533 [Suillus plorans]